MRCGIQGGRGEGVFPLLVRCLIQCDLVCMQPGSAYHLLKAAPNDCLRQAAGWKVEAAWILNQNDVGTLGSG